jgi:iron(III) transport system permease protein
VSLATLARRRGRAAPFPLTRPSGEQLICLVVGLLVLYLVLTPLVALVFSSVRATGDRLPFEATSFTLANYVAVLTTPTTYRLLLNTVWYATGSVALALLLAVAFSFLLERTDLPARRLFRTLLLSAMAVPGLVNSMAWILLANPSNGLLNRLIQPLTGTGGSPLFDVYSIPWMIAITGVFLVPSMYVMIAGSFSRMDPALEDAAAMSGAGALQTLRYVTLPLLRPALLAAGMYYFILVTETFDIPAILGLSQGILMFSTMIYQATHPPGGALPDFGLASGYAMLQLGASIGLITVYGRLVRNRAQFSVITGKAYRPRVIALGRLRYPVCVAAAAYFLATVVLPFLMLVWASLLPFYAPPSVAALGRVSGANYQKAVQFPALLDALQNTAVVGLVVGGATVLLATLVAWMSVRAIFPGSALPERLSFLVVATPSIVFGLALMFLYLAFPVPIYGTVAILIIALVTRFLPFATRVMSAALLQIHRELEEAARISGADFASVLRKIIIPLVSSSFLGAWLWVVIHAIRETTLMIMLFVTTNLTLGSLLWITWMHSGDIGLACAIAVPLVVVSAAGTWVLAGSHGLAGTARDS